MAEAATLGALLLNAQARHELAWLRVEDFSDPWHRELFAVIAEDRAAGRASDAADLGLALRDRLGPVRADLHRVAGVLAATPVRPAPERYALMVLEASVRRTVAQQGILLRAGGLQASLSLSGAPVRDAAAVVRGTVRALQTRWSAASGDAVAAAKARHPAGRAVDLARLQLGADRFVAAHPARDPDLDRSHERALVACLVSRPDAAPAVASWLKPEHLLDPEWAAVYATILELVEARQPVDEVAVAWGLQQSELRIGRGPDLDVLRAAVEAGVAADPKWLATRVGGDLARRTAELAAASLVGAAGNRGLAIPDLLHTADVIAGAVGAAGAGLPDHAPAGASPRHLSLVAYPEPVRAPSAATA